MIPMLKQLPLKIMVIGYRLQFDKIILSILTISEKFSNEIAKAVSSSVDSLAEI